MAEDVGKDRLSVSDFMKIFKDLGNSYSNEFEVDLVTPLIKGKELEFAMESVRKNFSEEYQRNPDDYYELDLKRLLEEDSYCARFIYHSNGKADKAYKMVQRAFKWRKEYGIREITEDTLSEKHLALKVFYPLGTDRKGREVVYAKAKNYDPRDHEELKKIGLYLAERVCQRSKGRKVTCVLDAKGVSFRTVLPTKKNMANLRFGFEVMNYYIPFLPSKLIVMNFPVAFQVFWLVGKKLFLKEEHLQRIKFVNKESILEHINEDELPVDFGGKDNTPYETILQRGFEINRQNS